MIAPFVTPTQPQIVALVPMQAQRQGGAGGGGRADAPTIGGPGNLLAGAMDLLPSGACAY